MSLNVTVLDDSLVPFFVLSDLSLELLLDAPLPVVAPEELVSADFTGGVIFFRLLSSLFNKAVSDFASESSRFSASRSLSAVEVQPVKTKSKQLQSNGVDFDIVI